MKNTGPFPRLLPLMCVILGLSPSGAPAGLKGDAVRPLQQEVRVVYKLIQVTVLDPSGNPVGDLAKEDFELFDNGEGVAFDHFERHAGGPPEATSSPEPGRRFARRYFFVFDFGIIRPKSVAQAGETALRLLDEIVRPGDEIAVVSFSMPQGLKVHEYLTSDPAKIRRAVTGLTAGSYTGRADKLAQFWARSIESRGPAGEAAPRPDEDRGFADRYRETHDQDMGRSQNILNVALRFSGDMRAMARSLRNVPGIKNVILFSEGIPREFLYGTKQPGLMSLSEWSTGDELRKALWYYDDSQIPRHNVLNAHLAMMEEMKSSNCPVYFVDTAPLRPGADVGRVSEGPDPGSESLGRATLNEISSNTGGDCLGRASEPELTARAARKLAGTVYVLGYPVKDTWDGRYHKVAVKVLRKGCRVAAQAGYHNPKPYREYSTDEKLFQLMDLALNDNPQFLSAGGDLPFVALPVRDRGRFTAAGIARFPGGLSTASPGDDAEAFVLLLDERNDIVSITGVDLRGRREAPGLFDVRFVIPVKPGRYAVRFVVRNRTNGWGARGNAALTVPHIPEAAIWLDPPVLLTASKGVIQTDAPMATTVSSLYPYDAGSYAPALGAVPAGTEKLFAVLRCPEGMQDAELEVSASLSQRGDPEGFGIPVSILITTRRESTRALFLEIPGLGLAPGDYLLKLVLREKERFRSATTAVWFGIR